LLAAADPIVSDRGVLRAGVPSEAGALEAAIAQTAQPEARMGKICIDVVPVPYADGRPGFAHVLPLGAGAVRGGFGPRFAAAAWPDRARPPSAKLVLIDAVPR
jgi:hypothetical protein